MAAIRLGLQLARIEENGMSLVMRKPVFGVCNQLRLEPAGSADETS